MILVYSKIADVGVDEVIDYLLYRHQVHVIRIGPGTTVHVEEMVISDECCNIYFRTEYSNTIDAKDVKSVWMHGGGVSYDPDNFPKELSSVKGNLDHNLNSIFDYILFYILKRPMVRRFGDNGVSNYVKLRFLKLAKDSGLSIPTTLVSSDKNTLKLFFFKNNSNLVTKSLDSPLYIESQTLLSLGHKTECITENDINNLSENSFPSLVQNNIDKLYELRIFFIQNKIFPMAIFSQFDEKTKIDFRNYNEEKPNRFVPYVLPELIEKKLRSFLKKTKLNSGSIDMIVSKKKEFIFLEVNPCGQFAFVSNNCNYYIEKYIAELLNK